MFLKWDLGEICFMTRQSDIVIEYQFIYLPKSSSIDDFTILDWSSDLPVLWDRLLCILETQGPDMSVFKLGPWSLFGVTSKQVQSRVGLVARPVVAGILHCSGWENFSTLDHYREYLNMSEGEMSRFGWILNEMISDPIPPKYTRHVSEQKVYWVDSVSGVSTWKHPHYDKYIDLFKKAKSVCVVNHWRSIAFFQLEHLHWAHPLSCLFDIGRIFKINLAYEPFLFHTVAAIARQIVAMGHPLSIALVDDCLAQISAARNRFELVSAHTQIPASVCVECALHPAVLVCKDCSNDIFCASCFDTIHATGSRKMHVRSPIELANCAECGTVLSMCFCPQCKDSFCSQCATIVHNRGGRRQHVLRVMRLAAPPAAVHTVYNKMKSPWVKFNDTVSTFINLETLQEQRDCPLFLLNDPC